MRLDGNGNNSALKIGAIVLLLAGLVGARILTGDRPIAQSAPPEAQSQPQGKQDKPSGAQMAPDDAKKAGLKITDTKVGTGQAAKAGDHVTVHYRGSLDDGSIFDESYKRGQPFDFALGGGQVIKGWDVGVVGMKVGGKRTLVIPSALGYGDAGSPPKIPGGATLHFDIELLKVG